jgi:hypothetical protein
MRKLSVSFTLFFPAHNLPVIEELLQNPLPDSYLAYLRRKLALTPPA